MQPISRRAGAALVAALVAATGCAGASHSADRRQASPTPPQHSIATSPSPALTPPATPTAGGTPVPGAPVIKSQAFGMHYLGFGGHPYPPLPFSTARIWDMGVTWKDVAPTRETSLTGSGSPQLRRLDAIVATFTRRNVQPLLTLGMTPAWAARKCTHVVRGVDWGSQTCAPTDLSPAGPWGHYVRALATRYRHSVKYFELWNEPSLRNGWNDSVASLVQMQVTAHGILGSLGYGQLLLAPSIAFTDGAPTHGLKFLDRFLSQPGGDQFDIVSLHLYPADAAAKAGAGPEWSMQVALAGARSVLLSHGLANRRVWNTETNVGRMPAKVTFTGARASGMVARTYILASENHIDRTIWYAADDRSWGGTWLEGPDFASLTSAGESYRTARKLLVGKFPMGCSTEGSGLKLFYQCKFGNRSGRTTLLAVWTTTSPRRFTAPSGSTRYYTGSGDHHRLASGSTVPVSDDPVYVSGAFN